jgi:SAM-dependent methyltransferase
VTDIINQSLPLPPLGLAHRVGSLSGAVDPLQYYDALGRETRDGIVKRLPSNWTFHGKRVLDFGCGAGRTLRHFADQAGEAELWGCDIDEPSITWMREHVSPPFHVFTNGSEPPLDRPDESFDLIWAISVFTHLAENWSRWLAELNRVLKPDGLLFATFMGRGMVEEIAGEPWDDEKFGMNVIKCGQSWDLGGPMVIHSPWWIEEHWGRGFEIVSITPDGFASKPWLCHGSVMMRKRGPVKADELERINPSDSRETLALAHNVEQLRREAADLRAGVSERARMAEEETAGARRAMIIAQRDQMLAREEALHTARRLVALEGVLAEAQARSFNLEATIQELQPLQRLQPQLQEMENRLEWADHIMADMNSSLSWRVTAPLRAVKRVVRRGTGSG